VREEERTYFWLGMLGALTVLVCLFMVRGAGECIYYREHGTLLGVEQPYFYPQIEQMGAD